MRTEYSNNVGYDPFLGVTTSGVNLRAIHNTSSEIVRVLAESSLLFVISKKTINNFYKVIDVESSDIGWVHKNYVEFYDSVESNKGEAFVSTGTVGGENAEVEINNKSDYNVKLIVGSKIYRLSPHSTQTVYIKPGSHEYIATAPKVIPTSGEKLFERGHGYDWSFWVVTTRR